MFAILPIHVHVLSGVSEHSFTNIPLVFFAFTKVFDNIIEILRFQYIKFYAHGNHSCSIRLQSSFLVFKKNVHRYSLLLSLVETFSIQFQRLEKFISDRHS